jgi:hypothetical protein
VIVKSGTATFYMADDPTCSPHVVQAGSGFVDNGHDTHVVRNEGSDNLVTVVVSLVPAWFARVQTVERTLEGGRSPTLQPYDFHFQSSMFHTGIWFGLAIMPAMFDR